VAELDRLNALTPPDVTGELTAARDHLGDLEHQRRHLDNGTGPYSSAPVGQRTRELDEVEADRYRTHVTLNRAKPWQRPALRRQLEALDNQRAAVAAQLDRHTTPEARRLDTAMTGANRRVAELQTAQQFNRKWHHDHPEHATRTRELQQLLARLDQPTRHPARTALRQQAAAELLAALPEPDPTPDDLTADVLAALDDLNAADDHPAGIDQTHPNPEQNRSRGPDLGL
jgi:hypothetical protein